MTVRDTPWPAGTPCWVELMSTDIAAGKDFYAALLGWNLTEMGEDAGGYILADVDTHQVAGLGPMQAGMDHPSVWLTYLATDDADATAAAITAAGGKVMQEPFDVMELGRMAVAQDPSGATFAVWQAKGHIGVEVANEPGALIWNEIMSRDFEASKAFYAAVFGYTYADMSNGDVKYAGIEVAGNTVGGIGELSADVPAEEPAQWRLYFSVVDADKTAAQVTELGGSLLQGPQDMPYGRHASLADGQGANFAVITPPAG